MKKIILIAGSITSLLMASCTISHTYTTTGGNVGTKVGVAVGKATDVNADYTLQAAAKNGGITKIATIETIIKSYIFTIKATTTVTGE